MLITRVRRDGKKKKKQKYFVLLSLEKHGELAATYERLVQTVLLLPLEVLLLFLLLHLFVQKLLVYLRGKGKIPNG